MRSSFASDDIIFLNCNISSALSVKGILITLRMDSPHSFTERKTEGVIIRLHLGLAWNSIINSPHTWVFRVKPSSLNIGLLLRIERLRVNFTCQIGDKLKWLFIIRPVLTSSLLIVSLLELLGHFLCWLRSNLAKVVNICRWKKPLIMVGRVSVNDCTKPCLGSTDRTTA